MESDPGNPFSDWPGIESEQTAVTDDDDEYTQTDPPDGAGEIKRAAAPGLHNDSFRSHFTS